MIAIFIRMQSPDPKHALPPFLKLCLDYNINLHIAKSILFAEEIYWCGCLITVDVRCDHHRLNALLSMQSATTGTNHQQVLCLLQLVK